MRADKVQQTVFDAIKQETGIDASAIDPEKDIRTQVNLDSMQFVGMVARVEEALGVELPIEALAVHTLNEFLRVVRQTLPER